MGTLYRIDFSKGKLVEASALPASTPTNVPANVDGTKYVPRYCDPANERRGSKYDSKLSTKEIAALVRDAIKRDLKAGNLPKGTKVSVRYESFSGGSAIRVSVTAYDGPIVNRETLRHRLQHPHEFDRLPSLEPAAAALLERLSAYAKAYHRDNSDSMVDYFDVNFYGGDAEFDWQLRHADEALATSEVQAAIASAK